jgi:peptidoglycan-N-acetylglucosamine deacetylase
MVRRQIGLALLGALTLFPQSRQVAITFDDLPRGGDSPDPPSAAEIRELTLKLLGHLKGLPVSGFVNAGQERDLGAGGVHEILRLWVRHGAVLGNHTYSHPDIHRISLEQYTADIARGEPAIEKATGRKPLYFRHPFLRAGKDAETWNGLRAFLDKRGYIVAPVTVDTADYLFAAVYAHALKKDPPLARRVRDAYIPYMESQFDFFESRSREVVGREIPQVLLLHVNRLNADTMGEMVAMMQRRGYRIVSLRQALRDPAYRLADNYVGPGGFSWIHRWSITKGMKPRGEPEPEPWIAREFERLR